jgi:hypothetical protein
MAVQFYLKDNEELFKIQENDIIASIWLSTQNKWHFDPHTIGDVIVGEYDLDMPITREEAIKVLIENDIDPTIIDDEVEYNKTIADEHWKFEKEMDEKYGVESRWSYNNPFPKD